MKTKFLIEDF